MAQYNNFLDSVHDYVWNRKNKAKNIADEVQYMLNRSLLMFKYTGLPETIPALELERLLQTSGFAGITEINEELYALYGGLGGVGDAYGRPTMFTVANPYLRYNGTLEIGKDKDIILMRNDSMMQGLLPIFSKYTTLLNENEITMELASISKRVNNLISVADDNTADSANKYLEQLEDGQLGYIFESKLFSSLQSNPVNTGGDTSLTDLMELQQYLKASMYNEIGLEANYNMKRERLNQSEVEMSTANLYPLVDNMLENRQLAIDQINEKYDLNITVDYNSSWSGKDGQQTDEEDQEEDEESIYIQGQGNEQEEDTAQDMDRIEDPPENNEPENTNPYGSNSDVSETNEDQETIENGETYSEEAFSYETETEDLETLDDIEDTGDNDNEEEDKE